MGKKRLISELPEELVSDFSTGLRGKVFRPDDIGYDESRTVFNKMHDRRPGLIVRCSGTADVVDAVRFAAKQGLLLAVRSGGHSVASNSSCEGGLVIDLSAMNHVHVDARRRVAEVAGGATWGDVDRETALYGLVTPGGAVSTTGVAGLTLGGGIGWLMRKHGLACDGLLAAQVVAASGEVVTASAKENADLLWALQGGGGNFGVVTRLELQLHPMEAEVLVALPIYGVDQAPSVLPAWREWAATIPDEVMTNAIFWTIPGPPMPPELHGKAVFITPALYAGKADAAEAVLEPLRQLGTPLFDLTQAMPFALGLQRAFDPFFGELGQHISYWKATFLDDLSDSAIDLILRRAGERPDPWTLINIPRLGGAFARKGPGDTAFGDRSARFMLSIDGNWHDPAQNAPNVAWVRRFWDDLLPYSTGRNYVNFLGDEGDLTPSQALTRSVYQENYERLVDVKTKYDPTNLFQMNQNILPRGSEVPTR